MIPESIRNLSLLQEAIDEKLSSCYDLGDKGIWQKGIAILIITEVMSPQLQNSTDVEVLTNS